MNAGIAPKLHNANHTQMKSGLFMKFIAIISPFSTFCLNFSHAAYFSTFSYAWAYVHSFCSVSSSLGTMRNVRFAVFGSRASSSRR